MRFLFFICLALAGMLSAQSVRITPGVEVLPVETPSIRLDFDTTIGRFYRIESSEDLAVWKSEGYAFAGNGSRMSAMVSNHGLPRLFYRIRNDAIASETAPLNPYSLSAPYSAASPTLPSWDQLTGKPTTLAGFGITDAATAAQGGKIDNILTDVRDLGGRADVRIGYDADMTAGNAVLISQGNARFQMEDVGKAIRVSGAGPGGEDLFTTIASLQSLTQVTLAEAASTTVTDTHIVFGTDSSAAVQAAIDAAATANVPTVWLPKGVFMFNVEIKNGVTIRGSGAKANGLTLYVSQIPLVDETIIYPADSRRPAIHAQFAFQSQIEHLTVMGNPAQTTIGVRIGIPWSHQWLDGVTRPGRMNGDWRKGADLNGKSSYATVDAGEATRMFWNGSAWMIERDILGVGTTTLFSSTQDVERPDLVTSWTTNTAYASGTPVFRHGIGFVAQGFKISRCNLNAHRIAFQIMRSGDTIAEFVTVGYSRTGFFCGDQEGLGAGDGALFIACTSNFTDNVFKFNLTKQAAVIGGNFNYSKTFARIDEADVSFSNINIEDCTDQVFELGNNGSLVVNTLTFLRHPVTGPTVAIKGSNTYVKIDGISAVKYFATPATANNRWDLPGAAEVRIYSDTNWTTMLETRDVKRTDTGYPDHLLPKIREEFAEKQSASPIGNLGWTLTNLSGAFTARSSGSFKDFGRIQEIASATVSASNLCRLALADYQVWALNSFETGWTLSLGGGDVTKTRFRCGLYSMDASPSFTPYNGIGVRIDRSLPDSNVMFEVIKSGVVSAVDTGLPISTLNAASQLVISRNPYYLRLVIRNNGFPTGTPLAQVSHTTAPSPVMLAPMMLLGASGDSSQVAGLHSFYYVKYPD